MPELAPHVRTVPTNQIREITQAAWSLGDAVVLSIGEPGFPTDEHVLRAAIETYERDETFYTPNAGLPALRQALADRVNAQQGLSLDASRVYVVTGAQQGLHLAMSLTLDVGDEVLVPDPGYPTFTMTASLVHAVPVTYRLRPEDGFAPRVEDLEALVTPRTRAIVLNSPSNPLGAVFDPPTVRSLMDFAAAHDLWVISDECYEAFTYDGVEHVSPLRYDTDHRVIVSHTLSKTYGLTGLRIGALVIPPGMATLIDPVMEAIVSCVNPAVQHAAVAALTGPQHYIETARTHYRSNRDTAQRLVGEKGYPYLPAEGAFYLWVDVSAVSGGDMRAWCHRLLAERRVALAPGTAFGPSGEGWVRVALCGSTEDLVEGLSRLPTP
ncbi:pyridoxal phosphate-dependent aminotransferase [Tersicoccus sp. Bi-70]|uniref:pyridoxal phosphate-dependent aminotransferase n=1 Tax=Tersicoccus sp. Bi-70 TaxID=1897634 RepID=UPI0009770ED0|nr:pyridoxal phosphate-dependent aminotransferase [Tersicoccus sp. Bi-70]OMH31204.1 aspartate aminotransferase [Tersicoccus sp. Bi-70]